MERFTRTSERLLYRVLMPEDLEDFYEIVRLEEVGVWMGSGRGKTKEEALERIERYARFFNTYDYGCWGIFDKATGKLIGHGGLEPSIYDQVGMIYAFLPELWGKGYGSECCHRALKYGFEELGLPHIIAGIRANNVRSQHVVKKNGLVYQNMEVFDGVEMMCFKIDRQQWFNENPPD